MKKNLLLYILLAFLMVVNGFFIYKNLKGPDKRKHRSPRNFISSQLDFSPEQLDQFKSLEQAHRDRMKMIYDGTKELKDALYSRIHDSSINDQEIDSITTLLAAKEKEKDTEVFNYFRSISALCNDQQKDQLDDILKKARHRGRGGPPRHKKR